MGKIDGLLLERIDLHIGVPAVAGHELPGKETGAAPAVSTSAEMRERVQPARAIQMACESIDASMVLRRSRESCPLCAAAEKALEMAVRLLAQLLALRGFPKSQHCGDLPD
jgi:predicted ATPase with chaperone activity